MKKMGVFKKDHIISVLGVSFKKNTDDIRASMTIPFVKILLNNGLKVKVHDPMALDNFKKIFHNKIKYSKTLSECISHSDCCVLMTGWDEYKNLKPKDFEKSMNRVNVIDAQRILEQQKFEKISFSAIGLGT